VAYALLQLPHLDGPPDVLLDPFCGSGTILQEAAAHWPDTALYGNDWDDDAAAGARLNVAQDGLDDRIDIRQDDAWYLADTFADLAGTVDLIATNPPFGMRIGRSMDFFPFYRRVLSQMAELLHPGGYVVLLVLRQQPFQRALDAVDGYDLRHVRVVEIGGLYPRAFVLQRD
jgi:putative N6-adenine-specific DNA methylase/tRNA (guanine6-N2)-methyltransferase